MRPPVAIVQHAHEPLWPGQPVTDRGCGGDGDEQWPRVKDERRETAERKPGRDTDRQAAQHADQRAGCEAAEFGARLPAESPAQAEYAGGGTAVAGTYRWCGTPVAR
jgi:hypothetical protein